MSWCKETFVHLQIIISQATQTMHCQNLYISTYINYEEIPFPCTCAFMLFLEKCVTKGTVSVENTANLILISCILRHSHLDKCEKVWKSVKKLKLMNDLSQDSDWIMFRWCHLISVKDITGLILLGNASSQMISSQ